MADKGYVKDKRMRIKFVLILTTFGSIGLIITYSLIFNPTNLLFLIIFLSILFLGTFLFGGVDPLTQATLGDVSPPQIKSTVYSLNFIAYTFGRSVSLLIFANFYNYFGNIFRPGFLILSIIALCSSSLVLVILKKMKD